MKPKSGSLQLGQQLIKWGLTAACITTLDVAGVAASSVYPDDCALPVHGLLGTASASAQTLAESAFSACRDAAAWSPTSLKK